VVRTHRTEPPARSSSLVSSIGVSSFRIFGARSCCREGEAIETGLTRTIEGRDIVMRSLIRAVCRFRDVILVAEKKGDFGSALQNLVS
jgi:hypothetical protein